MCLFVGNIVSPGVNRQKGGDTTRQHLVVKHESYLLDDVFDLIQKHAPTWSNFANKMKTQPNSIQHQLSVSGETGGKCWIGWGNVVPTNATKSQQDVGSDVFLVSPGLQIHFSSLNDSTGRKIGEKWTKKVRCPFFRL